MVQSPSLEALAQQVYYSQYITEHAGLWLWSQDYSTGSYTELHETSPTLAVLFKFQDQYGDCKMMMMMMMLMMKMTATAFRKQRVSNVAV